MHKIREGANLYNVTIPDNSLVIVGDGWYIILVDNQIVDYSILLNGATVTEFKNAIKTIRLNKINNESIEELSINILKANRKHPGKIRKRKRQTRYN